MNRASGICGYNRVSHIDVIEIPEEEKKGGAGKVLKNAVAIKPPDLAKEICILEVEWTQRNPHWTHHTQTLKSKDQKIKILKSPYQ